MMQNVCDRADPAPIGRGVASIDVKMLRAQAARRWAVQSNEDIEGELALS